MEDKIIDIIYNLIKDKNLYNYDNDEELKSAEVEEYKNLLNESVIKIKIGKNDYIITCEEIFGEYNY